MASSDTSTLTLFFTVVVAFVVIRWFIVAETVDADAPPPPPGTNDTRTTEDAAGAARARRRNLRPVQIAPGADASANTGDAGAANAAPAAAAAAPSPLGDDDGEGSGTRHRRPVTEDMIAVVAAMAPTLAREQIVYDLETTGNIEATIEKYLATGTLPFPPHLNLRGTSSSSSAGSSSSSGSKNSLISKYQLQGRLEGLDDGALEKEAGEHKMRWSSSREARQAQLAKQRELMILQARRKLEKQDAAGKS